MKRSPLKRGKPLARGTSQLKRSAMRRSRPKRQPLERRDDDFKAFVRTLPCCAPMRGWWQCANEPCDPHHKHEDGKGLKSHDRTCIPLCRFHHGQAESKSGDFKGFTKQQTRDWHDAASAQVLELYERMQGQR